MAAPSDLWKRDTAGLTLIESVVVSPAAASVTFSAIPQTYKHLKVFVSARSAAGAAYDAGYVRFNGDAGTNYLYGAHQGGSAHTVSIASSQTQAAIFAATGNGSTADLFGGSEITLYDYTGANKKTVMALKWESHTTSEAYLYETLVTWADTSAITSILFWAAGGNLGAGCRFDLYGVS
jgi:hypothetical protein